MIIKSDLLIKRSLRASVRSDEGLLNHGNLSENLNLNKFAYAWNSAHPNGVDRDVILPDATTLDLGWEVTIHNTDVLNGKNLIVKNFAGTQLIVVEPDSAIEVTLHDKSTAGGQWFTNDIRDRAVTSIEVNFSDSNRPFVEVIGTTYTVISEFVFNGSNTLGNFEEILVSAFVNNGEASVRIFDETNGNVICENINITNTSKQILSLGPISNIPTGSSIFEIQAKSNSGGSKIKISSLNVKFPSNI